MKYGWWHSPRIGAGAGSFFLIVMALARTSRVQEMGISIKPPGATSTALTAVRCVPAGPMSGAPARAESWHPVGDAVHVAIVWNPRFQSYDLLFMNSGHDVAHVRFNEEPRNGNSHGGARRLAPGERESLPGQSVTPRPDGRVCLQIATGR